MVFQTASSCIELHLRINKVHVTHGFILAGGNALPDNLALAAGILHVLNESIDHLKKH